MSFTSVENYINKDFSIEIGKVTYDKDSAGTVHTRNKIKLTNFKGTQKSSDELQKSICPVDVGRAGTVPIDSDS